MVATTNGKNGRAGPRNVIEGSTRRQMFFSIWFNQTYQGIQITLAYNISVYLVRHFSAGESEERIGQLTGILASAFSSAQFCTSYGWGLITDKVGRKPVVVLANLIMGIATLGLGLAPTYWLAVMARCLGGAANGSGVAIKTMLAEACDATSQARGMAFLNLGWGMGNILGPMIGGFLSQPCDRWPSFPLCDGGTGLFARQPFLPPCLVVGILSLLAMTNSAFMMVETHPRMRKQPKKAPEPKKAPVVASPENGTSNGNGATSEEKNPVSMFAKSAQVPEERGSPSMEEPPSPMMRLSSGIGAGKEEARQLLRRASSRFNGLLSGYRSLSVTSDDLDRHEYVLEMSNTREPDGSIKGGSGWEDRQGLVPNDSQQLPEEAPGSLARVSESSKKSGELDAAADGLTISSHRRHSLGGAMSASRAPRTPRFFFGRSSSLQEGSEPAASSRASQGRGIFGGWGRKGEYSVLENQEDMWKHAERRRAAMDEDFRADSSEEEECGEGMPMLQRRGSAAVNAKLSLELPGQSGLQDWVGGGQVPVSPRPSGRLLSGQLSSHPSTHLSAHLPAEQLQTAASKPESIEEAGLEPRVPWYRQRSLQLVLVGYSSIAFLMNFLEELTPIYASAPYRLGGLNLTPDQIALPVSFAGLGLVFFALLAYPRIQKRLGCMNCAKLGLLLAIPLALAIPMSSFAAPHYAAIQACLIPTMGFKAICSIMCMTSSMILVNITSPLEDIGPVNGFGNMLAAGMRALGPALAGQLWALSLAVVDSGAQFVAFGVVASAFLCTRLLYGRMRI